MISSFSYKTVIRGSRLNLVACAHLRAQMTSDEGKKLTPDYTSVTRIASIANLRIARNTLVSIRNTQVKIRYRSNTYTGNTTVLHMYPVVLQISSMHIQVMQK